MARRRHYRGLGSLVRFPGLGSLSMPKSVNPVDVALGVGLGFAGSAAIKAGTDALAKSGTAVPSIVTSGGPLLGGVATAALLYVAQKKKNPSRAAGHAMGALLGGLAVWGYSKLQSSGLLPSVNGYGADLRTLPNGYGAPIFDNPRVPMMAGFNGPIFDNPGMNLGRLAQLQGMGDEAEDGIFPAP